LRQTDLGQIYIALYNIGEADVTGAYGDLYVEYDVTLKSPNYMNKSIKSHRYEGKYVLEGQTGRFPPLLGGTADGTPTGPSKLTTNFENHGHEHSTLGVSITNQTIGTSTGIPLEASRIRFEEPFHGKVIYYCKNHLGTMDPGSAPILSSDIPNGLIYGEGYEPQIKARAIKDSGAKPGGTGRDWNWVWDVVAAAGAVLDLSFNGTGTLAADVTTLTLTDVAAGLLSVALL
jgi:hypothetical protein